MDLVAAQVEEAVAQAHVLREPLVARHLHRQHVGGRLHGQVGDPQLDLAGGQPRVDGAGLAPDHLPVTVMTLSSAQRVGGGEGRGAGGEHALGQAVMVAQVDEQQTAMVALAMHPAGQASRRPGVGGTQRAAGMGAVGVHGAGPVCKGLTGRLVGATGIEPVTPAMSRRCSTAELRAPEAVAVQGPAAT